MIDNQIIAPVLIHLFTAVIQLACWRKTVTQRVLSVAGGLLGFLVSLRLFIKVFNGEILTMNAANWEAPFGIVFVADTLSTTLVLLTSIAVLSLFIVSVFV